MQQQALTLDFLQQGSESEPQLILMDTKSTSKETASDSESSSESPSFSSSEEEGQEQPTGPFILNHQDKRG